MDEFKVYFEANGPNAHVLKDFIDEEYIIYDIPEKVSCEVPRNWSGFRHSVLHKILKTLNEAVYVGIVFITDDLSIMVEDFFGDPIKPYECICDGKKVYRYVKKQICTIKTFNKIGDTFEVKRYVLNAKYSNPVVKVLDIYCARGGGFTLEDWKKI